MANPYPTLPEEDKSLDLEQFLEKRGVSGDRIAFMRENKIDVAAIELMSEEDVQRYLPHIGDVHAVQSFARSKSEKIVKKYEILQQLRDKMKMRDQKKGRSTKQAENKPSTSSTNAKKTERVVSFHWSHYTDGAYISVGKKDYGGTREGIHVPKDWRKDDLISKGLSLYFDGDISTKGERSEFIYDISLDARGKKILGDMESVEDVINVRKIKNPRFYLLSKKSCIDLNTDSDSDGLLPGFADNKQKEVVECVNVPDNPLKRSINDLEVLTNNVECEKKLCTESSNDAGCSLAKELCMDDVSGLPAENLDNEVPLLTDQEVSEALLLFQANPDTETVAPLAGDIHVPAENELPDLSITDSRELPFEQIKQCKVNRSSIFDDMIAFVIKEELTPSSGSISVKITNEKGADSGGVFRDTLSDFWDTFYKRYTVGELAKVPVTVHTLQATQWQAIGTILVLGYKHEGYFPILLAKPLMEKCIYDTDIDEGDLIEIFLTQFIPPLDRKLFQAALDDFEAVDLEDLLDTLVQYEGRVTPTKDNMWKVINELAHHQLLQKPSFVLECWSKSLRSLSVVMTIPLSELYLKIQPDIKKVLQCIKMPENNIQEKQVGVSLKRYLKGCSDVKMKEFLRFVTGSDLLITEEIKISVTPPVKDFVRRPIAHTCGCVLELPSNYMDYLILREDLDRVLDSKVLVMDIV